jgi:hypothetical protein
LFFSNLFISFRPAPVSLELCRQWKNAFALMPRGILPTSEEDRKSLLQELYKIAALNLKVIEQLEVYEDKKRPADFLLDLFDAKRLKNEELPVKMSNT